MSGYLDTLAGDTSLLLAQPAPLVIGDLVLQGHEVPGRITIGGAQSVTMHKMPGGRRIIDAMGVDDGSIKWRGIFSGPDAAQRARKLDVMRQQGAPCVLSFGDYTFNVIVVHYEYDFQDRGAVIAYRIKSEIIPDALNLATSAVSLDFAVQSDLVAGQDILTAGAAAVATYSASVGLLNSNQVAASASILSALATGLSTGAELAASTTMESASSTQPVQAVIQAAAVTLQRSIQDNGVASLAAPETGIVFASSASLAATTSQAACLAALVRAGGYLNRASTNLASTNAEAPLPLIHA